MMDLITMTVNEQSGTFDTSKVAAFEPKPLVMMQRMKPFDDFEKPYDNMT